jgi:hypothetical protein
MSDRITDSTVIELKKKIESLPEIVCYSVNGKFFAGFGIKDKSRVIIKLSKDLQLKALLEEERLKIDPFKHGAKMGWIEIDISNTRYQEAFYWVKKGYEHALNISKST